MYVFEKSDVPGLLRVQEQNYPIGQWNGNSGFVLKSEYVTPEPIPVSKASVYRVYTDPTTGNKFWKLQNVPEGVILDDLATNQQQRLFAPAPTSPGGQNTHHIGVMLRRNTGIKSLYPHPSRFINENGKVILKPVDWADPRVNYKDGGKIKSTYNVNAGDTYWNLAKQ